MLQLNQHPQKKPPHQDWQYFHCQLQQTLSSCEGTAHLWAANPIKNELCQLTEAQVKQMSATN